MIPLLTGCLECTLYDHCYLKQYSAKKETKLTTLF